MLRPARTHTRALHLELMHHLDALLQAAVRDDDCDLDDDIRVDVQPYASTQTLLSSSPQRDAEGTTSAGMLRKHCSITE